MSDAEDIFVGREPELAALHRAFATAQGGNLSVCVVRGDTGTGKSTLLRRFAATVATGDAHASVAIGHCDQLSGSMNPLLPWSEILKSLSGITEDTPGAHAPSHFASLRSAVKELAPDLIELLVPGVGLVYRSAKLFGKHSGLSKRLRSPGGTRQPAEVEADRYQLQDQYLAIINAVLGRSPFVIMIDDVHCIDDASLDLLGRISRQFEDQQLLIVIALRPLAASQFVQHTLTDLSERVSFAALDLDEAQQQRGAELVNAYVEMLTPGVDAAFVQQLAVHTGGHPLFVAELLGHLLQHGFIAHENGRFSVKAELPWNEIPGRISAVLEENLADASDEVRQLLQLASVEGDVFTIETLALLENQQPLHVVRALTAADNLIQFAGHEESPSGRVTRYRFRHSLARHFAYESIAPGELVYLHEGVANILETRADGQDQLAPILAYHFDKAGITAKALHYHFEAAAFSLAACALSEAEKHLQRALTLAGAEPLRLLQAKQELARIQTSMADFESAEKSYADAIALAEAHDAARLPALQAAFAVLLRRLNQLDRARELVDSALAAARTNADPRALAEALAAAAMLSEHSQDRNQALTLQSEATSLAGNIDDPDLFGWMLYRQGWCEKECGLMDEAASHFNQALDTLDTETPNYGRLAAIENGLADLYISRGDLELARAHLTAAINAWQRYDQHSEISIAMNNFANLANREGKYSEAADYARKALDIDNRLIGPDNPDTAFAMTCLGEAYLGLKDYAAAAKILSAAYQVRTENDVPEGNLAWTSWLFGRALVQSRQDPTRGFRLINDARQKLANLGNAAVSEVADIDAWLQQQQQQQ